ncbi:transketolase [Pusillimonas sp. TS35]|uniref:transketolase n=1 Tax=Paracandidimonas lactea TaxID=2895524 RepID=UPI00137178A0|nr:transketolase [Paracandidimonas lactea]MYN13943.1 transketolase [Pusillimonas sp. TS35]
MHTSFATAKLSHSPTRAPEALAGIALALRKQVVRMVARTGQGYVQQGLGAADLFTVLYFSELRLRAEDANWPGRDRFILSTAHNTAVFYATLAARGLIDTTLLDTYCEDGSPLEINASERLGSVIEATCGSLGQGLSVGAGMAAALKQRGSDSRVYVMLGDGELQEGQVWEAATAAGNWQLDNLCLIIDANDMQVEGHVNAVQPNEPLADKWQAFRWHTQDIDGHDIPAIQRALDTARTMKGMPHCIIARTLVGKGAPSLEGILGHNLRLPPSTAMQALNELSGAEG